MAVPGPARADSGGGPTPSVYGCRLEENEAGLAEEDGARGNAPFRCKELGEGYPKIRDGEEKGKDVGNAVARFANEIEDSHPSARGVRERSLSSR